MDTNNNIDFKGLWVKQNTGRPDSKEVFSKLKALKRRGLMKLIVTNILFLVTSVFIISTWHNYQPQFMITKAGIVLMILAMAIYLVAYNRLFTSYTVIDSAQSNSEFLQKLIALKTKQQFLYSTMLNLYFVVLSAGIFLYMYEPALSMTAAWACFAYAATLAWVGFNWFYTRPRTIRKHEAKINELIARFESMTEQLIKE